MLKDLYPKLLVLILGIKRHQIHKFLGVYGQGTPLGRKPLFVGQKSFQATLKPLDNLPCTFGTRMESRTHRNHSLEGVYGQGT